jgi:uncharacterized protein involved in exopolysaccharide biosynthesis
LLVVLFATSLGIWYAWKTKPKYQSRLTFALEENSGGMSGALNLAAEFGLNLGGSSSIFSGDNILQIISSRRVIEGVLLSVDTLEGSGKPVTLAQQLLDLKRDKKVETVKPLRLFSVSFPAGRHRNSFNYLEDSVLYVLYNEDILKNLIAGRPDKKLGIYEVMFTASDERFAKVFTERLLHETTTFYTDLRSKKSRQTLEVLEARVASLKSNVGAAIQSKSSVQDANLNPVFSSSQAVAQQRQVDITAYSGAYAELFKNLELARYQFLQDIPLLQIIDNVHYPLKKIKKGRLFTGLLFGILAGILMVTFFTLQYKLNRGKNITNG